MSSALPSAVMALTFSLAYYIFNGIFKNNYKILLCFKFLKRSALDLFLVYFLSN